MNTMTSTAVRVAGIDIRMEHRYGFIRYICRDYITDGSVPAGLAIASSEDEIREALSQYETVHNPEEAESLVLFLKVLASAWRFDLFPLHAAVIEYEGRGYAFAAPSGTGKSTHVRLWREVFGDAVHVINGDKPLLKAMPDPDGSIRIHAFGTPWCGKEGQQENRSVPLEGLCFLQRGSENAIRPCGQEETVGRLWEHIPVPACEEEADFYLRFTDQLLTEVPAFVLSCRPDHDAVRTASRVLLQKHERRRQNDEIL